MTCTSLTLTYPHQAPSLPCNDKIMRMRACVNLYKHLPSCLTEVLKPTQFNQLEILVSLSNHNQSRAHYTCKSIPPNEEARGKETWKAKEYTTPLYQKGYLVFNTLNTNAYTKCQ